MQDDPHVDAAAEGEEELSLARLTAAFAEVLGQDDPSVAALLDSSPTEQDPNAPRGDDMPGLEQPAESTGGTDSSLAVDHDTDDAGVEDAAAREPLPTPLGILEAILFVGHPQNEPVTAQRAASVMRGVEPAEIHDLVGQLNREYDVHGCPYRIVSEGAGYRLALREEFHPLRDRFYGRVKAARLSQAAIECLALVAYNQPLERDEIDTARGVASSHVLAQLVRRRLLRIERTETVPRKTLYYTTRRLLTLLGLQKLDDLPQALDVDRP